MHVSVQKLLILAIAYHFYSGVAARALPDVLRPVSLSTIEDNDQGDVIENLDPAYVPSTDPKISPRVAVGDVGGASDVRNWELVPRAGGGGGGGHPSSSGGHSGSGGGGKGGGGKSEKAGDGDGGLTSGDGQSTEGGLTGNGGNGDKGKGRGGSPDSHSSSGSEGYPKDKPWTPEGDAWLLGLERKRKITSDQQVKDLRSRFDRRKPQMEAARQKPDKTDSKAKFDKNYLTSSAPGQNLDNHPTMRNIKNYVDTEVNVPVQDKNWLQAQLFSKNPDNGDKVAPNVMVELYISPDKQTVTVGRDTKIITEIYAEYDTNRFKADPKTGEASRNDKGQLVKQPNADERAVSVSEGLFYLGAKYADPKKTVFMVQNEVVNEDSRHTMLLIHKEFGWSPRVRGKLRKYSDDPKERQAFNDMISTQNLNPEQFSAADHHSAFGNKEITTIYTVPYVDTGSYGDYGYIISRYEAPR